MPPKPMPVLLNALHTNGGGGLIYLAGLLPHLAANQNVQWQLLITAATFEKLKVPPPIKVRIAPALSFGVSHLWEQLWLPFLARAWGCHAVLSNANYGPVLAPRASVILHTTPRAAQAWQGWYWRWYWRLLKILTKLCVWRAPRFFAVANHIVADYASPTTARKLRLAPPAINHEALPPPQTRVPGLVLAVGDFYPQKNYPLLLKSFAKLLEAYPQARLQIVGRPVQLAVRDEILRLAHSLGISQSLTLVPGLPHAQLLVAIAKASLFVNTSQAEAFNMPVLEAMACETPTVLPDTVFQREVAADTAVYVPTEHGGDVPAAMAIAMLGLLSNPNLASVMGKRGQARAKQFSWAQTAKIITDGLTEEQRKQA
jgi:glycosyltransferase involved in cell wall biosynthesis